MPASRGGQGLNVHQAAGPVPGKEWAGCPSLTLGSALKRVEVLSLDLLCGRRPVSSSPGFSALIYRMGTTALQLKGYREYVCKTPGTQYVLWHVFLVGPGLQF